MSKIFVPNLQSYNIMNKHEILKQKISNKRTMKIKFYSFW